MSNRMRERHIKYAYTFEEIANEESKRKLWGGIPTTLKLLKKSHHGEKQSFRNRLFELATRRLFESIHTITVLLSDLRHELELLIAFQEVAKDTTTDGHNDHEQTIQLLKSILRFETRADILFTRVILPMLRARSFIENGGMKRTKMLATLCQTAFLSQVLVVFMCTYTSNSNKRVDSPLGSFDEQSIWSERSETVHATLYELLEHEAIHLLSHDGGNFKGSTLYETMMDRESVISRDLLSAWRATGHNGHVEMVIFAYDGHAKAFELDKTRESLFRELCYSVLISMDQWCPVHPNKLKATVRASLRDWYRLIESRQTLGGDVIGNELVHTDMCSSTTSSSTLNSELEITSPIPQAARDALNKVSGMVLPRDDVVLRVLKRILPPPHGSSGVGRANKSIVDSVSSLDTCSCLTQVDSISRLGRYDNQLDLCHLCSRSVVAIAPSISNAGQLAGIGKTTIAALVVHQPAIRKHFKDGVAWISCENLQPGSLLTYTTYRRLLQAIWRQLQATAESANNQSASDGWPEFPEMVPSVDDTISTRAKGHVEDGFKAYCFDRVGKFLANKRVLLVLDSVYDKETLQWFMFAPTPSLSTVTTLESTSDPRPHFSLMVTTRNRTLLPAANTVELDTLSPEEAFQMLVSTAGVSKETIHATDAIRAIAALGLNNPMLVSSMKRLVDNEYRSSGVNDRISCTARVVASLKQHLEKISTASLKPYEVLVFQHCIETRPAISSALTNCLAAFGAVFDSRGDVYNQPTSGSTSSAAPRSVPISVADCLFHGVLRQIGADHSAASVRLHLTILGFLQKVNPETACAHGERSSGWNVELMHSRYSEYALSLLEEPAVNPERIQEWVQGWNIALAEGLLQSLFSSMDDSDMDESVSEAQNEIRGDWGWTVPTDRLPMFNFTLQRLPVLLIRGGLFQKAFRLLCTPSFQHERILQLGVVGASESLVREVSMLLDHATGIWNRSEIVDKTWKLLGGSMSDLLMEQEQQDALNDKKHGLDRRNNGSSAKTGTLQIGQAFLQLGASLCSMSCWKESILYWESSRDAFVAAFGEVSDTVAALSYNLGIVHLKAQMYDDAIYFLTECLRIRRKLYGEKHCLCAETLACLSDAFLCLGEYSDAMKACELSLDMLRHKPRLHRDKIGDIQQRLGHIHLKLSDWNTAMCCFQSALLYWQADFGEECPELASVYQGLGMCHKNLGDDLSAIECLDQAVSLARVRTGCMDGIANWNEIRSLVASGLKCDIEDRRNESLTFFNRALGILQNRRRELSDNHVQMPVKETMLRAFVLDSIASIHQQQSDDTLALQYYQESLAACSDESGREIPCSRMEVANTLSGMARSLRNLGRIEEAMQSLDTALEIRQRCIPSSALVASTHEQVASIARVDGDVIKAQSSLQAALEIRKKLHGDENHEAVAAVLRELSALIDEIW